MYSSSSTIFFNLYSFVLCRSDRFSFSNYLVNERWLFVIAGEEAIATKLQNVEGDREGQGGLDDLKDLVCLQDISLVGLLGLEFKLNFVVSDSDCNYGYNYVTMAKIAVPDKFPLPFLNLH